MERNRGLPGAARSPLDLDDPAWFGAVMGTGATATVASLHPGRIAALATFADVTAQILLLGSMAAFVVLFARFVVRGLGRHVPSGLRSPRTGAAYATIPGAVNVLAIASVNVWTGSMGSSVGWWVLVVMAGIGTLGGLWLTVVFFVNAFEHEQVTVEDISGIWFIPETVVLLGSLLFGLLAVIGPVEAQRSLAVVSVGLLGAGGLLFGVTAVIFVNRLVLHAGLHRTGAASMWIMVSPLAVTSLALQSVAGGDLMLAGSSPQGVTEATTFAAGLLWGFAMWWMAAATVVTRHAGRGALTRTAADWGFVFPSAAMVIATLTLARRWESALVEALGLILGGALALVWLGVIAGAVLGLRRGRGGARSTRQ